MALRRPCYNIHRRQESSLLSLSEQLPGRLYSDLRFAPMTCERAQTLGVRCALPGTLFLFLYCLLPKS